ncbi:ABC transporter ATP-binding protein [Marinivivus vitaminiproducens]|uniref:ABC transporter ATP-binding protein n=1 Tax=Marinivivus vitaminiproducens TaxID=3035935 RepID=UPI0027AB2C4B|nr:ABC transporter ATP-binding protein [Geminicoccaceae bacterium SCSIO 64248]
MSAPPFMVTIEGVSKRFGGTVAVDDVSATIRPNEFFALLGPSGCGKTTLLRMIAGFEWATEGSLAIDGQDMDGVPPNRRPVNMVFQSYAVFPHMTVAENVAYGLKVTGVPRSEIGPRVEQALAQVRLDSFGHRRPDQLSGGQRQRVALARALIKRPKVLLLDEPLSALDKKLREEMQLELVRLQHEVGITFIIVTHDQDEALSMANRIAVMNKGKIVQVDTPDDIYERPANMFVADFLGSINTVSATVEANDGRGATAVDTADFGRLSLPPGHPPEGNAILAVRPEKVRIGGELGPSQTVRTEATLEQIAFYGDYSRFHLRLPSGAPIIGYVYYRSVACEGDPAIGSSMTVGFAPEDALLLGE